jgi:hypothetical protein
MQARNQGHLSTFFCRAPVAPGALQPRAVSLHFPARGFRGLLPTELARPVNPNLSIIERAFQLAKSGQVSNVDDLRARLKQEGYDPRGDFVGRSLKSQLRDLIKTAQSDPARKTKS